MQKQRQSKINWLHLIIFLARNSPTGKSKQRKKQAASEADSQTGETYLVLRYLLAIQ